jgi:hypothetical protein
VSAEAGQVHIKQQIPVDTANLFRLYDSSIYAVACRALSVLGDAYANGSQSGNFVGYRGPFNFSHAQADAFRDTVNTSVVDFVNGEPVPTIVQRLQEQWENLADQFLNGWRQNQPDAYLAGLAAAANQMFVGSTP